MCYQTLRWFYKLAIVNSVVINTDVKMPVQYVQYHQTSEKYKFQKTVRLHLTPVTMADIKKTITNADENGEKGKFISVNGNINQ